MEDQTPSSDTKKDEPKGTESTSVPVDVAQSSNQEGINGPFPAELNRWNWGAFFLTFIWGTFHSVWVSYLILFVAFMANLPIYGYANRLIENILFPLFVFLIAIYLGANGNELAWKNRKFESVEQFGSVQRRWKEWGNLIGPILTIYMIIAFMWHLVFLSVYYRPY